MVVGSGYGGAIAASRLARAGRRVCLLERGRELHPGQYPDSLAAVLGQMQAETQAGRQGSPTALYDFRLDRDINVFVGCGLGGTSLVNANVSLEADARVFQDPCWPPPLRDDRDTLLADGFHRARQMLQPVPYPESAPELAKLRAHQTSAARLGGRFERLPLTVTFRDGPNAAGVEQRACRLCGDCITGCNHGAKNTVLMNYLPDAARHGAEIYTETRVRHLERRDGRWLVHCELLEADRPAPSRIVAADLVILAAGSLGSTEILLRSAARGLPLSDHVGRRFTGNGDVFAFAYNNDQEIQGIGFGEQPPEGRRAVGPSVTSMIDLRDRPRLEDGLILQEGAVPGAIAALVPAALRLAAHARGYDTDEGPADLANETLRESESLLRGPYYGAVRNTQALLVLGHDDDAGRLYLEDDRLRIEWPGLAGQPVFQRAHDRLREATAALGGTFVPDPVWSNPTTVHPLGGCVMAESAAQGVVNHRGQVFSDAASDAVYDDLYVCDGAVIPRPLGVNPLLTISALAERCCHLLARDRGWDIDYALPEIPL